MLELALVLLLISASAIGGYFLGCRQTYRSLQLQNTYNNLLLTFSRYKAETGYEGFPVGISFHKTMRGMVDMQRAVIVARSPQGGQDQFRCIVKHEGHCREFTFVPDI